LKVTRAKTQATDEHQNLGGNNATTSSESNQLATIGILYATTFFITWVWYILWVAWVQSTGNAPNTVNFLFYIFQPLQGFFNCLVYFYRVDKSICQSITNRVHNYEKKWWISRIEKSEGWSLEAAPSRMVNDEDIIQAAIVNNPQGKQL